MTSPTPLQYGEYYHIFNRGNNGENLFIEERNYLHFLRLYAQYVVPIGDTYAYCLLRNHFHVLLRIKTVEEQEQTLRVSGTLRVSEAFTPKKASQQFGNLFNAYAKAFNKAYNRTGSLFEHPFGRVPVTSEAYLVHLVTYIHQNAQKHGFVGDFRDWPYSSYHAILSQKSTRLERDEVLGWFQGLVPFQDAHRQTVGEAQIANLAPDDFD
jgi:putative transposase